MIKTIFLPAFLIILAFCFNSCQKVALEQNPEELTGAGSKALSAATALSFSVSRVFGDNMVLQRDKPAAVWGVAGAGATIRVKASWNANTYSATATESNQWKLTIPAAPANTTAQKLYVTDGTDTITYSNILIGDVWICSGQSNMVMPVDSVSPPYSGYVGVTNYQQEIAAANWPLLRVTQVEPNSSSTPLYDLLNSITWSACNPNTVKAYSATAYFFGRKIMTTLNVPVGLVVSAVGGSSCEWWTNKERLDADPVLNSYYALNYPCSQLYNAMINPLRLMSTKGFIWYQGENNRYDQPVSNYTRLNTAMIKGWRSKFNQGALPFYFVQMPPFDVKAYNGGGDPKEDDYAFFREAQANVRLTNYTGMAVTMDAGNLLLIHPKDKSPVGERLALLALHKTYKLGVKDTGPQYSSWSISNNKATISFVANTANGLKTINNAPVTQYFFVAGTDSIFRQGTAVISNSKIVVTAPPSTPLPLLSVRYAFTNFPMPNLQNGDGLPMEPFRTDNWTQ